MAPVQRLALVLPLALSACAFVHASDDSACRVDGVRLEAEHVETLEIAGWHPSGIAVAAHCGDVDVVASEGPTRVVATLRERELGDARLVYEDGVVRAVTASGAPAAIRGLTLHASGEIPALRAASGLGDLRVAGVSVAGDCALETGLGDVVIADARIGGELAAATGMGDVEVRDAACATASAESGMGDVVLRRLSASAVDASTGMGDVELVESAVDRVGASTGMGDVRCAGSTYRRSDLSTGMGSIAR